MYNRNEILRLILALRKYQEKVGSFFPVDTNEMEKAIALVREAQEKVDRSDDARLLRALGIGSGLDGTEDATKKLINLATALTDYDPLIHDQLLYVRGHLVR